MRRSVLVAVPAAAWPTLVHGQDLFAVARNLVVMRRDPRRALGLLAPLSRATPPPPNGPSYQPAALWWRRGQACVQLGKPDSARTAYQQALSVTPTFRLAQLSQDSLRP